MVDNVVSLHAPQSQAPESPVTQLPVSPVNTNTNALFDSIAQERADVHDGGENSSLQKYFTAVLWFGYAIAIVVALVLVWSGSKELLSALPH